MTETDYHIKSTNILRVLPPEFRTYAERVATGLAKNADTDKQFLLNTLVDVIFTYRLSETIDSYTRRIQNEDSSK